jgi:ribosomal protein L35AE/L33A
MSVAPINIPSTVSTADTVRVSGKIDCEAVIEELDELLASISLKSGVVVEGAGCADEKPCVEPLEGTVAKSHGVKGVSEFNQFSSLTHPSWIDIHADLAHLEPSDLSAGSVASTRAGSVVENPCVEPLEGTVAKSHGVKGVSEFNHSPSLTHPSYPHVY